jgi:hypothetical protein
MDDMNLLSDEEIARRINNRSAVRIIKKSTLLILVILGLLYFQGCIGMGEFADMAEDRVDAVEDLSRIGRDVSYIQENVGRALRSLSGKKQIHILNASCRDAYIYSEQREYGVVLAETMATIYVDIGRFSDSRGEFYLAAETVGERPAGCRASGVQFDSFRADTRNDRMVVRFR